MAQQDGENIRALARIAEIHERRLHPPGRSRSLKPVPQPFTTAQAAPLSARAMLFTYEGYRGNASAC